MLMSILDSDGVRRRRRHRLKRRIYQNKVSVFFLLNCPIMCMCACIQGPDFVWHLDGYDKLKPYSFCVHGCIDGEV